MYLAPNVYIARLDRRSVILDLDRDRYIGLNANLSDLLQRLFSLPDVGSQIRVDEMGAVAKLLRQGLLTGQSQRIDRSPSRTTNIAQATISTATSSLWALLSDERTPDEPLSFLAMMSALGSLTEVATSLRVRSFKSTISWLANTKIREPRRQGRYSAQDLIDAFYEIRPYFPLKPICRLDAPSLCLHLRRNGQPANLILGVRLDPFRAHCWVQIGEVAISEPWDRVRQYTPILVV